MSEIIKESENLRLLKRDEDRKSLEIRELEEKYRNIIEEAKLSLEKKRDEVNVARENIRIQLEKETLSIDELMKNAFIFCSFEKGREVFKENNVLFENGDIFSLKDFSFVKKYFKEIKELEDYSYNINDGKLDQKIKGKTFIVSTEDYGEDYLSIKAFFRDKKGEWSKISQITKYGNYWDLDKESSEEEFLNYIKER